MGHPLCLHDLHNDNSCCLHNQSSNGLKAGMQFTENALIILVRIEIDCRWSPFFSVRPVGQMLFIDPRFLFLFLPVACGAFYFICRRFGSTAGLSILLFASLIFYAQWGTRNFELLAVAVTVNFSVSLYLMNAPDAQVTSRRSAHAAGQLYNFGTLFFYKYSAGFFALFTPGVAAKGFSLVNLAIPIGISFYTFQQAIFLLDAFHRKAVVRNYLGPMRSAREIALGYLRYAFFVLFFPHLIIGPIVYLQEFQPQIAAAGFGKVRRTDIEVGLTLFALGLFKKVVMADHLGHFVDETYVNVNLRGDIPMLVAWLAAFSYYAQLYFDFSGYADMALGSARLFGIRYPINFYSPLKAASIVDFYRRWHITLTRVIARFVFTPLSLAGTRFGARRRLRQAAALPIRLWFPLLINFEIIALWHGARLTFALFGLIHGTWYVLDTMVRSSARWNATKRMFPVATKVAGRVSFTIVMALTFALFRSPTIADFAYLLSRMLGGEYHALTHLKTQSVLVVVAFAIIWLMPNSIEFLRRYRPGILTYGYPRAKGWSSVLVWRPNLMWSIAVGLTFAVAAFFALRTDLAPFLYMGF